jgi:prepilin-type N-terminal cleavage/methylation domain-containing protein
MMYMKVRARKAARQNGFSFLELLIVMAIAVVAAAFAVPAYTSITRYLRIAGDARDLNAAINEAKMRAASGFTRSRVYADLAANTFRVDVWNKTLNGGLGCFQAVNDISANVCSSVATGSVQNLSAGITYGTASVGSAPPNTQTQFAQAPSCVQHNGNAYGLVSGTACITFNSRGIPINPALGTPVGNDAFYITDNNTLYGVTVGLTGVAQVWTTSASGAAAWEHR